MSLIIDITGALPAGSGRMVIIIRRASHAAMRPWALRVRRPPGRFASMRSEPPRRARLASPAPAQETITDNHRAAY